MKLLKILLFSVFAIALNGQANSETSSSTTVSYDLYTSLDTITAGAYSINIENTGSTICLVEGDSLRAGKSISFSGYNDGYIRKVRTLPAVIINPGGRASGTLTLTGNASDGETATIGSTTYRFVDNLDTAATQTLTITGAVENNDTVVIESKTYRFQTTLLDTDVVATDTLRLSSGNAADGDSIVIDGKIYIIQDALTVGDGHIRIGATDTITIDRLAKAINKNGQPNVDYSYATTIHSTVSAAVGDGDTTLIITAKTAGTGGNSITATETLDNGSFTSATLLGGLTAIANDVKLGASDSLSLDNLMKAVNGTGVAGTDYTTLTAAHTLVTATQPTATTFTVTADANGTTANSYTTTETMANGSWGAATMTGGVDQVANDVLIAGSASLTIDNFIAALNLTGTIGTDYGNGTTISTSVYATAGAGDTMDLEALSGGTAGNSTATTETMTNGSFGAATLENGTNGELSVTVVR